MTMKPFADDTASSAIGDLAAENGQEAVTLSGSLQITRDKHGLKQAKALKSLAEAICAELEAADLPDRISQESSPGEDVANPFA